MTGITDQVQERIESNDLTWHRVEMNLFFVYCVKETYSPHILETMQNTKDIGQKGLNGRSGMNNLERALNGTDIDIDLYLEVVDTAVLRREIEELCAKRADLGVIKQAIAVLQHIVDIANVEKHSL